MAETKYPNNYEFAIVLALTYRLDPAAAVVPVEEWRAVVLSGDGTPTNKALARYPEAGDGATPEILLGIVNAGGEEALRGGFPDAAETHISVVESGRYIIEVADGETINAGELIDVDVAGKAVAAGTGEIATPWVAIDSSTTSTVARPSYIRVKLS